MAVVSFTAVADFQKVQSEAKKTQQSLNDLQKQIDANNAKSAAAARSDSTLQANQLAAGQKADQQRVTFLARMGQIATAQKQAATNTAQLTAANTAAAKAEKAVSDANDTHAQAAIRAQQADLARAAAVLKSQAADKLAADAVKAHSDAVTKFGADSDKATTALNRSEQAKTSAARASLAVEAADVRASAAMGTLSSASANATDAMARHEAASANVTLQHNRAAASADDLGARVVSLGEKFATSSSSADGAVASGIKLGATWISIAAVGAQLLPIVVSLAAGFFSLGAAIAPAVGALAALPVAASVGAAALGTVFAALAGVSGALKANSALTQANAVGGTAAASTAIQNAQAVAAAQHGLQEAYYNAGLTAQQNADAARSDAQAVTNALFSQAQAQVSLNLATVAAAKNIRDLALASQQAALSQQNDALSLTAAQQALTKVMNDPNSTLLQRQQAQLAVQQAQLQLQASKNAASDATDASNKASAAGVAGAQNVIDAQHNVEQQQITVADAYRTQAEQATAAAHSTADATYNVAQAVQALANAQRTAGQNTTASGTAAAAYAAALAKLTPEGRDFVAQLLSMKGGLKDVEDAAATATLPGFTSFLRSISTLFPTVKGVVSETGAAIGGFAKDLGTEISSPAWMQSFQTLGAADANIISILGGGFRTFIDIMRQLTVAAIPFTTWLAQGATNWINHRAAVLNATDGYSRFTTWLGPGGPVRTALTETGKILENIGDFFYQMGKAAGGSGRDILTSIDGITGKWAAWAASTTGQADMRNYFAQARDILKEVSHAIGEVFDFLGKLSDNSNTKKFLDELGAALGPFAALIGQILSSNLGQNLITIVEQLFKAFQDLTGNGAVLGGFADALEGVVSALSWFVQVPGIADIIGAIALAFGAYKALNFLSSISGIKGLTGAITDFVKAGKAAPAGSSLASTLATGVTGIGVTGSNLSGAQKKAITDAGLDVPKDDQSLTTAHRQAISDAGLAQPVNAAGRAVGKAQNAVSAMRGKTTTAASPSAHASTETAAAGTAGYVGSRRAAAPTEEEKSTGTPSEEESTSKSGGARATTQAIAGGAAAGLGGLALGAGLASQIPAFAKFAPILQEIAIGAGLASAAMTLLDIAMDANVVTLIVVGLIALGAALYEAYEHSKTFRDIVNAAWKDVKTIVMGAWNDVIKPVFNALHDALDFVIAHWKLFAIGLAVIFAPITAIGAAIYELATHWRDIWNIIQGVWSAVGKPLFDIIKAAIGIWWTVNKEIFDLFVLNFKLLWTLGLDAWNTVGKPMFSLIGDAVGLWWSGMKLTFSLLSDGFSLLWGGLQAIWNNVGKPVFDGIKLVVGGLKDAFQLMSDGVQTVFNGLSSALSAIWTGIEKVFTDPITWLINTVLDQWLIGNINKVITAIGIPGLPSVHLNDGGPVLSSSAAMQAARMATGGQVPGAGNTDTVPAMLTPGEFVIRKDAAAAIGPSNLQALNSMGGSGGQRGPAGHYLFGGGVLGDVTSAISAATSAVGGFVSRTVRGGAADVLAEMLKPFRSAIDAATGHMGGTVASALDREANNIMSDVVSWVRGVDKPPPVTAAQSSANLDSSQMYNAMRVLAAGQARGASARDVEVAFMTGMTESSMRALANPNVPESLNLPHDGIGTDHDSVGVFQQRDSWGSAAARLDPYQSANLFYDRLLGISNRNGEAMGNEAQQVQVSAYPDRYASWQTWAQNLYSALTNAGEANLRAAAAGYATGGRVPGAGNRDTVPAMLTPGEFVINKQSAAAIGPANLAMMNNVQKLNAGGPVLGIAPGASGPYISALRYQMNLRDAAASGFDANMIAALGGPSVTNPPQPKGPYNDLNADGTGFPILQGPSTIWSLMYAINQWQPPTYDYMADTFWGGNMPWSLPVRAYENDNLGVFSAWLTRPTVRDTWMQNFAGASAEHKGWMSGLQTAMQLPATGDMTADDSEPFLHSLYHALGTPHSAGLAHPWSGPLTTAEQALSDSDRANTINAEWFADLQQIAGWGFKYLLDDLLTKGPADGLDLANSAISDKTVAQQLDDSLKKAATTGLGALSQSDQTNVLNAIASLAAGSVPGFNGPVGIRALAQLLQIPDYGVVNLYDRIMASGTSLSKSQTAQLTTDVTAFRQGTFYAAGGGRVPGSGTGDTVPAMLTPGEFVLKKAAADALGMGNLTAMNNLQAFADGGLVAALNSSGVPAFMGSGAGSTVNRIKKSSNAQGGDSTVMFDVEINNPTGENSAYSMLKMLQGQSATGVFDRGPKGTPADMSSGTGG